MRWKRECSRGNSGLRFIQVGELILVTQLGACQILDGPGDALVDGFEALVELQQSGTGSFVPTTDDGMGLVCWAENPIRVPDEPPLYLQRLWLFPTPRLFDGRKIEISGSGHTSSALAAVTVDTALLDRVSRCGVTCDELEVSGRVLYGSLNTAAPAGDVRLLAELNTDVASPKAWCLIIPFEAVPPDIGPAMIKWQRIELKTIESHVGGSR
jgi:hypothetical protein